MTEETGIRLTPAEQKSRRARNIAIALGLVSLVVIFYVVTLVRLGGNVASRVI